MGTPAFMAPEQARGREDLDCRGDLFSLGGILYRMVTGKLPFPADHTTAMLLSLLSDDPIPPRKLNPAIPPALEALILRLLAKDPAARPQSARLVVEAIRALEQHRIEPGPVLTGSHGASGDRRLVGPGPSAAAGGQAPVSGGAGGRIALPAARDRGRSRAAVSVPRRDCRPGDGRGPDPDRSARPAAAARSDPPRDPGPSRKGAVETWPTPPPAHPRLPGLIPAPQSLAGLGRWQQDQPNQ